MSRRRIPRQYLARSVRKLQQPGERVKLEDPCRIRLRAKYCGGLLSRRHKCLTNPKQARASAKKRRNKSERIAIFLADPAAAVRRKEQKAAEFRALLHKREQLAAEAWRSQERAAREEAAYRNRTQEEWDSMRSRSGFRL